LPELRLNPGERRPIGRAEAGTLDPIADQTGDDRGRETDAHDAQEEGHDHSQDTRVYDRRSTPAGRIVSPRALRNLTTRSNVKPAWI
jgi:hypothetical protein